MPHRLVKWLAAVAAAGCLGATPAIARDQKDGEREQDRYRDRQEPLVIQSQGSFYVGHQNKVTAFPSSAPGPLECGGAPCPPGNVSVNGLYVEYQIPQHKRFPFPIVMIHGAGHTGKTWDETPDGREGWKTHFLRMGYAVYVVDHAGRGRSGFDPTRNNQAKATSNPSVLTDFFKFTNEASWVLFRIGAVPYQPYAGSQFPAGADVYDQYMAQLLPNTESTIDPACQTPGVDCNVTVNSIAALLDRIGPAVVMGHSQGGTIAMRVAAVRPHLVKAVVPVEPASACVIEDPDIQRFKGLPMLAVFGDNLSPIWVFWSGGCMTTAHRIRGVGGHADVFMLPSMGIHGNSHMLMMEQNNKRIANLIGDWLRRTVERR
jgi:pimeloyl-ACP methyl ester carboxylesterase